jgi:hypothetical protein
VVGGGIFSTSLVPNTNASHTSNAIHYPCDYYYADSPVDTRACQGPLPCTIECPPNSFRSSRGHPRRDVAEVTIYTSVRTQYIRIYACAGIPAWDGVRVACITSVDDSDKSIRQIDTCIAIRTSCANALHELHGLDLVLCRPLPRGRHRITLERCDALENRVARYNVVRVRENLRISFTHDLASRLRDFAEFVRRSKRNGIPRLPTEQTCNATSTSGVTYPSTIRCCAAALSTHIADLEIPAGEIHGMTVQDDTYSIRTLSAVSRLLLHDSRLDEPDMTASITDVTVDGRTVGASIASHALFDGTRTMSSLLVLLWPPQQVATLLRFKLAFHKRTFFEPSPIQVTSPK